MILQDGMTLMHEHTCIDLSKLKQNDDCKLKCLDETLIEYRELYNQGFRNIVDVTNIGMGRDIQYVAEIAQKSKLNIIYATGFYQHTFLPQIVFDASVDMLAEMMIREITVGIDETDITADIIGEIGTSKNQMTEQEEKVFLAAMLAAKETGKNLTTHTTLGTYGREQVSFFEKHKFPLNRVMIGHVDLTGDSNYVLELLEKGVYVELDTIGKVNYMSDEVRVEMLQAIEQAGFSDRVCLSLDITRKSHLKYQGGIGYTYLYDTFLPLVRAAGVSERFIRKVLVDNPQKYFAEK